MLMPAAGDGYAAAAARYLAPYTSAFAAVGVTLTPRPWSDGAGDADATLALLAWGYHHDVARWDAVLAGWPAAMPLFNPPALLRWNTRKTYLRELAERGVPIVPSRFGRADAAAIADAFASFACETLVVKPQVSAGSHLTRRIGRGDALAAMDDAIIQPFLPAIGEEGELSLLFIGGAFSHAVRKVAAPDDFRIQPQFGGRFTRFDPDPATLALAERVMAAVPMPPLYARVDLIRLPDATLALMELEAIEPDLYFDQAPEAAERLVAAVLAQ